MCLIQYLFSTDRNPDVSTNSKVELDKLLASVFYMDARKNDGSKYKLSSLKAIRFTLSTHFTHEFDVDIVKDPDFKETNNVFYAMTVQLKSECLGHVTHTPALEACELPQIYVLHSVGSIKYGLM